MNTSPFVRLNVPPHAFGSPVAHESACATRSASTASRSVGAPGRPGKSRGRPSFRNKAAYAPITGTGFMLFPGASP